MSHGTKSSGSKFPELTGKVSRRKLIKGTAVAVGAAAIAGAVTIVPVTAQDVTKVTFWTAFTDPDLAVLKQMVTTYNSQAKGHQVELVQIPPAQVTDVSKLLTAVRGGTGPDCYHLDRFTVAQRAADGAIEDLTKQGADDKLMANYIGFARQEASYNGKPYALPFDTDARALYYNKTMLQSVGVDPAEFDASKGPLTWDRVQEVGLKLNKKDSSGNYIQMGFVPWFNQGWHYTYGFSWGGKFFDEAKCQVTPDDSPIVQAFQWVQASCVDQDAQKVSAFATPAMQPNYPSQQNPFTTGRLAMQITGDWHIFQMQQYAPKVDYGITWLPVPKQGDKSVTWAGGWSVVIPDGAKHPSEAFQFMKWFAGEPGQRIYVKQTRHLPTWKTLQDDKTLFDERHQFFVQLLPTAKNRPPLPVGAKYWDELTTAWQATYLNQAKPADALKSVKSRVQPQLQRFCPVKIGEP